MIVRDALALPGSPSDDHQGWSAMGQWFRAAVKPSGDPSLWSSSCWDVYLCIHLFWDDE